MFHAIVKVGVALCLLAVLLAGCGGAENELNLAQAAERTEAAGSSRIAVHGTEKDAREEAQFECEGEADYADARIRIACSYPSGDLELIVIGGSTYVRGAPFLGADNAGRTWIEFPTKTEEFSLREFTPEKLLAMLREASTGTERVGEEHVRGDETVRYRLTVECEQANLDCESTSDVDVWIDGDGVVRRIALEDESAEGAIEFYDFGADVQIEPPPAGDIATVDDPKPAPKPVDLPPCGGVDAKPIAIEQATAALRRHGFTVQRSCGRDPVAAVISNEASGDSAKVLEREGLVSCFLFVKAQGAAVVVVRGADGADAELELANLTCSILADSPRADEKIRPLRQAFDELERAIRP